MIVRIDPDQVADIKAFLRKEADRDKALTPELAALALSLAGWVETTTAPDVQRTFTPSAEASEASSPKRKRPGATSTPAAGSKPAASTRP